MWNLFISTIIFILCERLFQCEWFVIVFGWLESRLAKIICAHFFKAINVKIAFQLRIVRRTWLFSSMRRTEKACGPGAPGTKTSRTRPSASSRPWSGTTRRRTETVSPLYGKNKYRFITVQKEQKLICHCAAKPETFV